MKKSRFVFFALIITMFVLTACGNGGAASTTIDVIFAEFSFTPNEFRIPAGQEITIRAANEGAVVHEFVIMKLGQSIGDDFGDEEEGNIFWEVEVDPGAAITQTFIAPVEPGEYQIVCGTAGHYIAGMIGKLIVVADE